MKAQTLITAALLCGAPIAIASSGTFATTAPAGVASSAAIVDDYGALAAEYEAVTAEFNAKLKTAEKSERRTMRANSPIKTYWPKFVAMSDAGEGQATFWLAKNIMANRDIRSKERGETLLPLYKTIVAKHAGAEWITDAVKSIASNRKYIGVDEAVSLLDGVALNAKDDNTKAAALYFAFTLVADTDEKKAAAYSARIADEFAGTVYGTAVRARSAKEEDSQEGKIAPSFAATTIDGHGFTLEDYRGKVVLLDFYGFW